MNLEQALIDCTAAITRLTTVLVTASEAGAVTAPAAQATEAVTKAAKSSKKATTEAVNEGDPAGTRYFHIAEHNTVYMQKPGDADCTLTGAKQVSGAEYLAEKVALAKKFPTASAVATPAPVTTAPTATAPAEVASVTFEQVVVAMRKLHSVKGNNGMLLILNKYGSAKLPELNGKAPNAVLLAEIEAATV